MDSDLIDRSSRSKHQTETHDLEETAINARLSEIETLFSAGRHLATREACADLLFKFQPAFATNRRLYTRFLALLERTKARHLKQRLVIAVSGASDDHDDGWS